MPPLETKDLKQYAVLWPFVGYDDYAKPVHNSPIELTPPAGVRWLTKRRMMTDAQGNVIALDATAVVARKIDPDSLIWLGRLAEWYGTGSGGDPATLGNELMIVKIYNEAPDLKHRAMNIRRDIGMLKYQGHPNLAAAAAANFAGSLTQFSGSLTDYAGAT